MTLIEAQQKVGMRNGIAVEVHLVTLQFLRTYGGCVPRCWLNIRNDCRLSSHDGQAEQAGQCKPPNALSNHGTATTWFPLVKMRSGLHHAHHAGTFSNCQMVGD